MKQFTYIMPFVALLTMCVPTNDQEQESLIEQQVQVEEKTSERPIIVEEVPQKQLKRQPSPHSNAVHFEKLPTDDFITETEKQWRTLFPKVYEEVRHALYTSAPHYAFSLTEIHPEDLNQMIEAIAKNSRIDTYVVSWQAEYRGASGDVYFTYRYSLEEIAKQRAFVQTRVKQIVSEIIEPHFDEYERVKAIHDYIVLQAAYDVDLFESCGEEGCETLEAGHTAYGLLRDGIAVCEGYARTFAMLLDEVGVENYYVTGYGDDVLHAWNMVKVDGAYYYVDVTWDDPIPNQPGKVHYDYFLVPSEELYGHAWIREDYPETAKTRYIRSEEN